MRTAERSPEVAMVFQPMARSFQGPCVAERRLNRHLQPRGVQSSLRDVFAFSGTGRGLKPPGYRHITAPRCGSLHGSLGGGYHHSTTPRLPLIQQCEVKFPKNVTGDTELFQRSSVRFGGRRLLIDE